MFWKKRHDKHPDRANPLARRVGRGDDRPTQPLDPANAGLRQAPPDARVPLSDDAATRLITPPVSDSEATDGDPPVAILLVIAGPGKGRLLSIGYGRSSLGRKAGERVRLDFGDTRIARQDHAVITYDERGRRFYLQHGGGAALTYHGEAPVLEPVTLEDGDRITLGDTRLLFRSLVGDDFDWSDRPASEPAP